ncbi:hypothetical protein ETU09_02795 [Apibacter muscae]|uniref:Uncharacterized protein n=1 Tax=Apibacter muscae TaxID=2509004 RepID=A0A563DI35_9FLAO|nr:hypothetical protein [Apibacter muscae]TWP29926.1 hypothetical protein ETU09_02795 [Apibacter muscae]
MKNNFLYKNKIKGEIDDSEDIFWFMSKEYNQFLDRINNSNIQELIEYILLIFKENIPNPYRFLEGFSPEILQESDSIIVKENIKRNDINSIKIELKDIKDINSIKSLQIIFNVNTELFSKLSVKDNNIKKVICSENQIVFEF